MRYLSPILLFITIISAQSDHDTLQPIRIGLALSGGGALGIAHVGVLKVLEQESIPINFIVGNSMGSVIAGFYAAGYKACQIESILLNANMTQLLSSEIPFGARYLPERQHKQRYTFQFRHEKLMPSLPSGLMSIQNAKFLFMQLLSKIEYNSFYDFDSLVIPFRTIAIDLKTGRKISFRHGRLAQVIRASMAVPGIFPPVKIGDYELIDGGIISNLPVDQLFEFAPDLIIASLTTRKEIETDGSVIDVILRSIDLIGIDDWEKQKEYADIVIEPNVEKFRNSDFNKVKLLVQTGEQAAHQILPQIRERIANHKLEYKRRSIQKRQLPIISQIELQGLKTTRTQVIRPRISSKEGDPLDFDRLINDLMNVYDTDFFEQIDYDLDFNQTQDSVTVILKFKEKTFGYYALGVRYDNFDGVNLGLTVGQGNIYGSGADIRAALNLGNPNEIRLGLTGTRLYNLPLGYRLDGFWRSIENYFFEDRISQYVPRQIDMRGGIFETGYILGKNAFFNLGVTGYKAKYNNYHELIAGPFFRIEYNNFNDLYFPTWGITYQIKGLYSSKAFKATEDFWKLSYFSEHIIPLSSKLFMHPRLEIGISDGRVALSEYFSSSGLNYIGFKKFKFMTEQKLVLSHSFDIKLIDLFNHQDYPVYFQVFTSAASFVKYNDLIFNRFNLDNFQWSAGIGIKANTPIGPMQLNFGYSGIKAYYIDELKISFSIGREFRYSED
ncbi:MAG: patatin-like phospholipase family protein [Candidatus Latescibacteria bacterium]|nr:patatin-like phospholipase family protein [Candidatus Latescibacterota bacterium]